MSRAKHSRLGDSWVVNDAGPGLIFPTIDSGGSSQLRQRTGPRSVKKSPKANVTTSKINNVTPRKINNATYTTTTAQRQPPPSSGIIPFSSSAGDYIISILQSIFLLLRQPIAILLAIYLFAGLVTLTYNMFTNSLAASLSPLCRLPLSSMFPICATYHHFSAASSGNQPPTLSDSAAGDVDPEFEALMSTHDQLSDILSSSSAAVSLPLDMKRSESSIRDLRQIVRFSSLSVRNELVLEFDGFIDTARTASYDLQKFNSHVGRTIDVVLSTARWTERILDDMALQEQQQQQDQSLASLLSAYLSHLLSPFQPLTSSSTTLGSFSHTRLLETYIAHTRIISDQLSSLITQASALLLTLQSLEDRLDLIHAIALQSQHNTQLSRADTLSHLWTMLGGNRADLARYESQLHLLQQVGEYRRLAWAHVSSTLVKLQAVQAELEELRERVGSVEAEAAVVPRTKDRTPLPVHLQAIRLGVERLEVERERARTVQRSEVAKVMNAAGAGIASLLLAQSLARAHIPFRIFERDASLSFRGQGYRLRLSTEGLAAIEAVLGADAFARFYDQCGKTGGSGFASLDAITGERVDDVTAVLPVRESLGSREGKIVGIARGEMRRLFVEGIEDRVEFDRQVKGGVRVIFADGTRSETGALLVGGEGIRSHVARQVSGGALKVYDTGARGIHGQAPTTAFKGLGEGFGWTMSGPPTAIAAPNDDYSVVGKPAADIAKALTRDWHRRFRPLFDEMNEAEAAFWKITCSRPSGVPEWPNEPRVTVIGDAVHSMTPAGGNGANTALQDSALLGRLLGEAGGYKPGVTAEYERIMRVYGSAAVQKSYAFASRMMGVTIDEETTPTVEPR
ncbi:hypothetical protein DV738_g4950, partial [Chaetothyriales sp. CBS 135597]